MILAVSALLAVLFLILVLLPRRACYLERSAIMPRPAAPGAPRVSRPLHRPPGSPRHVLGDPATCPRRTRERRPGIREARTPHATPAFPVDAPEGVDGVGSPAGPWAMPLAGVQVPW